MLTRLVELINASWLSRKAKRYNKFDLDEITDNYINFEELEDFKTGS